MAAAITANNTINLNFSESLSYGVGQTSSLPIPLTFRSIFKAAGVLLEQCNLIYSATLTFVASTPQTLALNALVDPITGATVDFARIRLLAIRNNSTTDGATLLVGDAVTTEFDGFTSSAGTITVYPSSTNDDGFLILQAPNTTGAVVGGSNFNLKLNPGSNAFTVDVLIAGCNA